MKIINEYAYSQLLKDSAWQHYMHHHNLQNNYDHADDGLVVVNYTTACMAACNDIRKPHLNNTSCYVFNARFSWCSWGNVKRRYGTAEHAHPLLLWLIELYTIDSLNFSKHGKLASGLSKNFTKTSVCCTVCCITFFQQYVWWMSCWSNNGHEFLVFVCRWK